MALQRIETDAIEDDAITTVKIAPNAVAAADIAADAITNVKVAAGAAIAVAKISGLGTAATLAVGTSANNVVQLDGSGRLPAVSGANLTGVSTDTSTMENNIAILAFKTQSANNLAKFNLVDQVIDEYKDGTGVTLSTAGQSGSTATAGYISSVTSVPATISSAAGLWSGDTSSVTFSGDDITTTTGSKQIYVTTALTGDFDLEATINLYTPSGAAFGVFRADETITGANDFNNMTNIWYYDRPGLGIAANTIAFGQTALSGGYTSQVGDAFKLERISGEFKMYIGGSLRWTYTQQDTGDMKVIFGWSGVTGNYINDVSWTGTTTTTNAAGTATSTANTALSAPTTGDICMLIENVSGTATLNTDLKAYVSRNGGTGWDQATLVDKGSWGINKKILTANNVTFSNSASGTDMRYKIEWANQSSGSKETRVHATSLAWA